MPLVLPHPQRSAPVRPPTPPPKVPANPPPTRQVPSGAGPTPWSPPAKPVTIHAGFDLVFFGGALMFAAIVCAIWALWEPLMLVLVLPFVASAAAAWWRWLSYRIVVGPRDVRIGRMFGNAHVIPFGAIARVRFLRVPQKGGKHALKVNWTADKVTKSLQVPFESPHEYRGVHGAPLQMWIERRTGKPPEVRLNLDFLGHPRDIQVLYETLPHVVSPGFSEATGPTEAMPRWW